MTEGAASPRKVAIFDLDGTITDTDTYRAFLLGFLARTPARWARLPLLVLAAAARHAGLRDNHWLKLFFLTHVLAGASRDRLERYTESFCDRMLARHVRLGAAREIARAKAAGDLLVLASASPDLYVTPLAQRLGFDRVVATTTRFGADGRLAAEMPRGNCHGEMKRARVLADQSDWGTHGETRFYTDCHSDLPLMEAVDRPIAIHPTRKLREAAAERAIPIERW